MKLDYMDYRRAIFVYRQTEMSNFASSLLSIELVLWAKLAIVYMHMSIVYVLENALAESRIGNVWPPPPRPPLRA